MGRSAASCSGMSLLMPTQPARLGGLGFCLTPPPQFMGGLELGLGADDHALSKFCGSLQRQISL